MVQRLKQTQEDLDRRVAPDPDTGKVSLNLWGRFFETDKSGGRDIIVIEVPFLNK